jgi:hypothetical protein
MPIPARYLSSFSSSTLATIETHAAQFRVSNSLFFRGAYTANVMENERRKFAPVIVFDAARVTLRWSFTTTAGGIRRAEDQATDRVHRLGQSKGVQVLKRITRNTIEEKIDALITRKGLLATELVRSDDLSVMRQFTPAELDELLSEA